MANYTSASALKEAIRKKASAAMNEVSKNGLKSAQENVTGFYTGTPGVYERTDKLKNSPESTGVSGNGSKLSTEIYLDQNYIYETGTWTTHQVMEAAETGNANLIGTPGFWEKTVDEMDNIIDTAFRGNGFK